jgi:hypothetical protein
MAAQCDSTELAPDRHTTPGRDAYAPPQTRRLGLGRVAREGIGVGDVAAEWVEWRTARRWYPRVEEPPGSAVLT